MRHEREHVVLRVRASVGVDATADRAELGRIGASEGFEAVAVVLGRAGEHAGKLGVGVDEHGVAELDEALEVLVGDAEQVAEHPDRDRRGDALDEVELAERQGLVEQATCEVAQERFVALERARREVAREQPPPLRVQRRVGLHEVAPRLELVGLHVLDLGDAADARGVGLGVLQHRDDVVVARHVPEAAPARLLVPVDRCLLAQQLEDVPGLARGEEVVVEEVDVLEARHGRRPT